MRAVVYDEVGGPEVLHLAEVQTPEPAADEALVRVLAVAVDFHSTAYPAWGIGADWIAQGTGVRVGAAAADSGRDGLRGSGGVRLGSVGR